jgi:DNA-binding NarL/FixJ family response regulator
MEKVNIILADDHTLVREGFVQLLIQNKNFNVLGEAKDGEELLKLLSHQQPDVVMLDLSMPKLNGVEALSIIQEQFPAVKVIVLTMHEEVEYAVKCIKRGVKGYLLKNTEPAELYTAIDTVADGGTYFSPAISNALIKNMASHKPHNDVLSEREIEVLQYVVKGMSAKMIADTLSISPRTVETHKINMMRKLKVGNTAELVNKAMQEKLTSGL